MKKITPPRLSSQLANVVYQIETPDRAGKYNLIGKEAISVKKHFSFDLSNGPVKGYQEAFFHIFLIEPRVLLYLVKEKVHIKATM